MGWMMRVEMQQSSRIPRNFLVYGKAGRGSTLGGGQFEIGPAQAHVLTPQQAVKFVIDAIKGRRGIH
jgi:hypothetical protein